MNIAYKKLFDRNYGIFTDAEQERIRSSRILIVGCGGIGGTVALALARSGMSRFILVEFDNYDFSNMNRQIGCFTDTLGRNKAEVIGETIMRINPEAEVVIHRKLLSHEEINEIMPDADIVFPAADDFGFSIILFRLAKKNGKPALFVLPSGTWAHVSIILPDSPGVEDIEGSPKLSSYEKLRDMLSIRKYRLGTYFYVPLGSYRIDYYKSFVEKFSPPAQLCGFVWLSSSIGAMEVLKFISGRWKPVISPRYWAISSGGVRIRRINGFHIETLLRWQRKIMWMIFQTKAGVLLEIPQKIWWLSFVRLMRFIEKRRGG